MQTPRLPTTRAQTVLAPTHFPVEEAQATQTFKIISIILVSSFLLVASFRSIDRVLGAALQSAKRGVSEIRKIWTRGRYAWTIDEFDNPVVSRDGTTWAKNSLCEACLAMVNGSELLRALRLKLDLAMEVYPRYSSLADLEESASRRCHLCTLLFYNIPAETRKRVSGAAPEDGQASDTSDASVCSLNQLDVHIFVGEAGGDDAERPLLQVFMQLSIDSKPLGNVLAVSKGDNRPVQRSEKSSYSGDPLVIRHVRSWIQNCRENHGRCRPSWRRPGMPRRLVFVGEPNRDNPIRVVKASSLNVPYLALSHCWGGVDIPKLTQLSHDDMHIAVDLAELPQNFRDAIELCWMLGIKYLWADSLCIIQDSPGDWLSESAKMSTIYHNALCTIAADASPNPYGGCFRSRNPLIHETLELSTKWLGCAATITLPGSTLEGVLDNEINTAPLNTRGWAFQERLLSRRVVHFGANTILFECNTLFAAEFAPLGRHYDAHRWASEILDDSATPGSRDRRTIASTRRRRRLAEVADDTAYSDARFGYRRSLDALANYPKSAPGALRSRDHKERWYDIIMTWEPRNLEYLWRLEHNRRWYDLVTIYTARGLTYASDRLIALAGIAERISTESDFSYAYGLWEDNFLYNLLWRRVGSPLPRPYARAAPSWSWGSIDSPVTHLFSIGSSIVSGFGSDSTRKFRPEDLSEWREHGEQAKLLSSVRVIPAAGAGVPRSIFEMEAPVVPGTLSDVTEDGNAVFQASDGVFARKCRLDILLSDHRPVWMVKISNHRAQKSVCHGLIIRSTGSRFVSGSHGVFEPFERIGCFKIIAGDALFRSAETRRIVLV